LYSSILEENESNKVRQLDLSRAMHQQDVDMLQLYHSSICIARRKAMESTVQLILCTKVLIMMQVNEHLQVMDVAIDHI
jgi:hypothetical protein